MNYIHNQDDYAVEPVRGLPAALPRGEFVLWQGAPSWRAFARQVFFTRAIAFLLMVGAAARIFFSINAGIPLGVAIAEAGTMFAIGAVGIAILSLLAWLVQKTTVYTITNKRIVLRIGVAIQKTFNVPFAAIDGASLRSDRRDTGNLSVTLKPDTSLAYLILWPHARPWRMGRTQPTLRAIANASNVAKLLTDAYTSHIQAANVIERSGARAAAQENDNAAAEMSDARLDADSSDKEQEKFQDPHFIPKPLVMMAASAALITVLVVAFAQWTGIGDLRNTSTQAEFSQTIQFTQIDAGRISVTSTDGEVLTTIEAGTDGLLRGALRGLNLSRTQGDLDLSAPFMVQRFPDDGVYLTDPLTNRSIRLESFGPIFTGATADLLAIGNSAPPASE